MNLLVCIGIFVILSNNVKAQLNKRTDDTVRGCSFMVRSCKTQCEEYPNDYVFWSVDVTGKAVSCNRTTPEESSTSKSNSKLCFTKNLIRSRREPAVDLPFPVDKRSQSFS